MAKPKVFAFIILQWEDASSGKLAERRLRHQFEPDSDVRVQEILDWSLNIMKEKHAAEFKCDVPEFKDAEHGWMGVDAAELLLENGWYRVQLHRPAGQEKAQQPKQQKQNKPEHLEGYALNKCVARSPNPTESIQLLDYSEDEDDDNYDGHLSEQSGSNVGRGISPRMEVEEPTNNTMLWDDYQLPAAPAPAVDIDALLAHKLDKQLKMQSRKVGIGTVTIEHHGRGVGQQKQQNSMLLASREIEDAEHMVLCAIDDTIVHLGQHLDARSGEFIEDSSDYVLQGEPKEDKCHQFNFGTDDFFELLGIGPQQKAQVIAEQCTPTGYAKILTTTPMAPGAKAFSLMEIVQTKAMKLDPFDEVVAKHCLSSELAPNATHLLTSISYGAKMAFVFSIDNPELDIDEVKKIVNNHIVNSQTLKKRAPQSRQRLLTRVMEKWEREVRVKVFAHTMFGLKKEDICLSEALELIGQLPELLKKADHKGLGHPLSYGCVPLGLLVRPEFLAPTNMPPAPISVEMVNMMAQTRQIFDINEPLLDALASEVQQDGYCISEQIYAELDKVFEEVQNRREQMIDTWCHALQQLQMPASSPTDTTIGSAAFSKIQKPAAAGFTAAAASTKKSPFGKGMSPSSMSGSIPDPKQQIAEVLEETKQFFVQLAGCDVLAAVHKKCQTAEWFRSWAVPFVARGGDLATALASSSQQKKCQYVFFHNADSAPSQNTNECLELFKQLISKGERCIYMDTSLAELPPGIPAGDRIAKFFLTKLVVTDYLLETSRKMNTCIVRLEGAASDESPVNNTGTAALDGQFELEIPCPKAAIYGGKCSNDECRWECDDCGQLIVIRKPANENTRVEHFHCASCGRVPLRSAKFRCKDADLHGPDDFVIYPSEGLADQLRYYGDKNLLILGETGVGKSTWINAFANFHTFGTLEEAMQSENPLCLIPTSFPLYVKDENLKYNKKLITIGPQDNNESNKIGQSQTKLPKAHVFEMKTGRLRQIDTPGMADTAGLKQDQQNFKYTLRYISTLEELHGIAIVMDAKIVRLTAAFRYCIGQLLTHLHRDAAKNIVFVFTKCGHEKNPGPALEALREFLEEVERNNGVKVETEYPQVYVMENNAFKFIHQIKQGLEYTNADFERMEYDWSMSRAESTRLIQYILNLKPHKPMDTFSLNQARSYILALAQPLARISQAIQTDITVLTDKRDWLEALDANEMDLETAKDAMKITLSYYEIEHLSYPRTVCASKQHTEIVLDEQGQQKILYKTICHPKCGLNDVPPETSHCNQLRGCWAFNGNDTCHQCGCNYTDHMHIRYLQHLKTRLVDDDPEIAGIAAKLEKTHDKKSAVEEMIILLEKRVDDQRAEQTIISKNSAKLSTFLKRHAIMTYNDAIEEYVLMSIKDEKRIAAVTQDSRKVEGLEDCLKAYREEKRIIDAAMDNDDQTGNDQFDVQAIYGELVNLHINGQNIKEMFDAEFDSQKKIYDFHEKSYARPNGRKASQNNLLTDKRDWLEALDANEMDLETAKDAMKITLSYYEIEHLSYPRTVCASKQHTEIVLDEQGQQKILYKTICHPKCGLNDVPPETSHCNQLRGCWAFNGNDTCHQCGCNYTDHMHIRYLQHLKTRLVDDDPEIAGIAAKLEKTHDKKSAVEEMIILLEKRVDDQRAEQTIISKNSAKLSTFLKRHAIMTYNDAIEEYVLMSIKDEKRIAAVTQDSRKVEGLEDCLKAYREEKRIIDAAMDNDDQTGNDQFDVQAIYGELVNLHINGQNIKEMFDAEFDSQKKIYDFHEKSYARPNGRKASQNNRFRQSSSQYGSTQHLSEHHHSSIHGQQTQQQPQQYASYTASSLIGDYNDPYNSKRTESPVLMNSMRSSFSKTTSSHQHSQGNGNSHHEQIMHGGGHGSNWNNRNRNIHGNGNAAYRHQQQQFHQQQHQQRNGQIGGVWRQQQSTSTSSTASFAASGPQMPTSSSSSNSLMGYVPVIGRFWRQ